MPPIGSLVMLMSLSLPTCTGCAVVSCPGTRLSEYLTLLTAKALAGPVNR